MSGKSAPRRKIPGATPVYAWTDTAIMRTIWTATMVYKTYNCGNTPNLTDKVPYGSQQTGEDKKNCSVWKLGSNTSCDIVLIDISNIFCCTIPNFSLRASKNHGITITNSAFAILAFLFIWMLHQPFYWHTIFAICKYLGLGA